MKLPDKEDQPSLSEDDVDGDGKAENGGKRPTQKRGQGRRENGQSEALI